MPSTRFLNSALYDVHVIVEQQRDVPGPLAKGGQRDGDHVEPVVQVLPEASLPDFFLELAVGGRDHAHVHVDVGRSANPPERPLFEEPQQLGLEGRHHLADFVEKHRAAVGRLEQSPLLAIRAGEGAALVPEQLALEQVLGQRRAGDVHERLRRAVAAEVNDLGGEILAGAALPCQEHGRGRAGGDLLQQRADVHDRVARADDAVEAVRLRLGAPQRAHFAAQPRRLERLLDKERDLVEVERLVGVVIRALLHRLDGRLDARVGRQQDDEGVGVGALHPPQDVEAIAVRQLVVEQDEVHALTKAFERFGGGCGFEDTIAVIAQPAGEGPPNELFIVDDEHRGAHVPHEYTDSQPADALQGKPDARSW